MYYKTNKDWILAILIATITIPSCFVVMDYNNQEIEKYNEVPDFVKYARIETVINNTIFNVINRPDSGTTIDITISNLTTGFYKLDFNGDKYKDKYNDVKLLKNKEFYIQNNETFKTQESFPIAFGGTKVEYHLTLIMYSLTESNSYEEVVLADITMGIPPSYYNRTYIFAIAIAITVIIILGSLVCYSVLIYDSFVLIVNTINRFKTETCICPNCKKTRATKHPFCQECGYERRNN